MIKHFVFNHKLPYFYRFHEQKLDVLAEKYPPLKNYLKNLFDNCQNEYFQRGPRGSKLNFLLNDMDIKTTGGHEISKLTKLALDNNAEDSRHNKVELFLLQNDDKTIAVEIPIWLETDEIESYEHLMKSKYPLTGHIDILRIEDGKIWIWDYKPEALKEKYAATQTFFYALMLSKRTKIPLENFRCGYFDENHSMMFKPAESFIKFSKPITIFLDGVNR